MTYLDLYQDKTAHYVLIIRSAIYVRLQSMSALLDEDSLSKITERTLIKNTGAEEDCTEAH